MAITLLDVNTSSHSILNEESRAMHELLHIVGLCPDSLAHIDLSDVVFANLQSIPYINLNTIKYHVTKRIRSRKATTNKR